MIDDVALERQQTKLSIVLRAAIKPSPLRAITINTDTIIRDMKTISFNCITTVRHIYQN